MLVDDLLRRKGVDVAERDVVGAATAMYACSRSAVDGAALRVRIEKRVKKKMHTTLTNSIYYRYENKGGC